MSSNTTPALRAVPDPVKLRTDTEEKLWQALLDDPGSTAAVLSTAAGIGRSTATKILARWDKDNLVTRTPGIADGGSRPADRWSITAIDERTVDQPTGDESIDDELNEKEGVDDRSTDDRSADGEAAVTAGAEVAEAGADREVQPAGGRLAPGALRGMVEDHLRENAGQEFSPNAVGKALNRSAGAVHNALEKLVEDGYAVRTSDKPKKYSCAVDPEADPGR
ncbi:MarR family transcriptional regulator [Saccharothrix sp. BKS2]|uniref:MarR family transcriptional regulator n=1 Tax=Saccharothrix sp. BKS2 TaxID=3064400 RepID=UPI0039E7830B